MFVLDFAPCTFSAYGDHISSRRFSVFSCHSPEPGNDYLVSPLKNLRIQLFATVVSTVACAGMLSTSWSIFSKLLAACCSMTLFAASPRLGDAFLAAAFFAGAFFFTGFFEEVFFAAAFLAGAFLLVFLLFDVVMRETLAKTKSPQGKLVPQQATICSSLIFVDGNYDNDYSKIALAITAAQLAKSTSVKEFGVGEDLAMNFFGWGEDSLSIVCQMRHDMMRTDPDERLERCQELCNVLRKYWGVTSLSMVAEGFCSMDQTKTAGEPLSEAFLNPQKPVKECLTVTHVSTEDSGPTSPVVTIVAVPYEYELGRGLKWLEMLIYPTGSEKNFRNSKFPEAMKKALRNRVVDDLPDESYDELRRLINANGFHIQEFF